MSSFWLEFVGPPGSGKSTLSRRIRAELNQSGKLGTDPVVQLNEERSGLKRPLAKLPYAIYGWWENPELLSHYLRTARCRLNVALFYNWLFVRGVTNWHARQPGITVCDQGLIQALWSFKLSEPDTVVNLFRSVLLNAYPYVPSLIVCVEASPKVTEARLANREKNLSRVGAGEVASYSIDDAIQTHQYTKKKVVEPLIETRPKLRVVTLENNDWDDLDENVGTIIQNIEAETCTVV